MVTKLKHHNPSANDLISDWRVLDASGKILGRLATEIAVMLMGKNKPDYVPHMLSGDFVVVINASEIKVTGNKSEQIVYKRYSGYPGNLKEIPYRRMLSNFPERVIEHAVKGMLPKNKLGARMIRRLKVYPGAEHPHAAQIIGTERRPEREAADIVKREEERKKAISRKKRAEAREEIAEEAREKATGSVKAKALKSPSSGRASTKKATGSVEAKTSKSPSSGRASTKKATGSVKAKTSKSPSSGRASTKKAAGSVKAKTSKSPSSGRASTKKATRSVRPRASNKSGEK